MTRPNESRNEPIVEWAVLHGNRVVKDALASQQEAEAYRDAIAITIKRTNWEQFVESAAVFADEPIWVGWREVTPWSAEPRSGS